MSVEKRDIVVSKSSGPKRQRVKPPTLTVEQIHAKHLYNLPISWKPLLDTIPNVSRALVNEYKRFLVLKVLLNDVSVIDSILSPSGPVDQVWHSHMLLPRHYADVCALLLHEPNALIEHSVLTANKPDRQSRYEQTRTLYEKYWGKPAPAEHWPDEPDPEVEEDGKKEDELHLFVRGLDGKTFSAYAKLDDPISKIHDFCKLRTGVSELRLTFGGKQLSHNRTLREEKFFNEATIDIFVPVRGC